MIETGTELHEVIIKYICDRCGEEIAAENYLEFQEVVSIYINGGYGSVFGDGASLSCHLCQRCVKEILGKYLQEAADGD